MRGKALPYRPIAFTIFGLRPASGVARLFLNNSYGRSKTFRTSGGKAADSQPVTSEIMTRSLPLPVLTSLTPPLPVSSARHLHAKTQLVCNYGKL